MSIWRDAPVWYPDGRALLFAMPPEGAAGGSIGREWRFVRLDLETRNYTEVGRIAASGLVRMADVTERSLFYLLGRSRTWHWIGRAARIARSSAGPMTPASTTQRSCRTVIESRRRFRDKPATILAVTPPSKEPVRVGQGETNSRSQLVWCSDRQSIVISGTQGGKQGMWRIPADDFEQCDITECA